jgi:hypothetical protein
VVLAPKVNPLLVTGAVLFIAVLAMMLLLPLLRPLDAEDLDYAAILTGPGPDHPLGTDALGRDLLARLVYGGLNSLAIGALVTVTTALAGTALGLVAASGLLTDTLTMRLMDVLMAFPALLLALAVLAALGNSAGNVVVALSLVYVPRTARIVRAEALVTRELPYVEGARAAGARMMGIFRDMAEQGVPMIVGTDAGVANTPFDETWLELALMVKAGLSPLEALRGATTRAARAMRIDSVTGAVRPGLRADLIALQGNPLAVPEAFREVAFVMIAGRRAVVDGVLTGGMAA